MEQKHSNRRFWLFCIAISFVAVVVAVGQKKMSHTVMLWQCSEVYKRYRKVEGVRATYVKDFRVNDTLTVGVTLLEATTDSGWAALQGDFGLPVIPKEYEERFCGDSNRVSIKKYPKDVPLFLSGDTLTDDLITISLYYHTICHFVIISKEQRKAIIYKQIEDNTKKNQHEKND